MAEDIPLSVINSDSPKEKEVTIDFCDDNELFNVIPLISDDSDPSEKNTRWDYVMMFADIEHPKDKQGNNLQPNDSKSKKFASTLEQRKNLLEKLKRPETGLHVRMRKGTKGDRAFVLITSSNARLEAQAEEIELNMRMKKEYGSGYSPFLIENKDLFEPWKENEKDETLFRPLQRIFLIESILESDESDGGAGLNLKRLLKEGVITKFYPLHTPEDKKKLITNWAKLTPSQLFKPQPLDDIRDYLGENIAMYFAWLGFYTQWLWMATSVGFVASFFWFADATFLDLGIYGWVTTAYSVFLALWATFFLEFWKRLNNSLNLRWGTTDYEDTERVRAEFKGQELEGFYFGNEWIPWESELDRASLSKFKSSENTELEPKLRKEKYYPDLYRYFKISAGTPLFVLIGGMVIVLTIAVLSIRLFVQNKGGTMTGSIVGGSLPGVLNAITINIMNQVWQKLAVFLNNWENHRTQSSYDDNLITKIFIFQFINSYCSLYYIGFFKDGNKFWGSDDPDLRDRCKNGSSSDVLSKGCINEVSFQLVTILATNIIIGQSKEFLIPFMKSKLSFLWAAKKKKGEKKVVPRFEKESYLVDFAGTFDEYSEMIIQYGYITLFAAAFPLAPLLAVFNNMIEIRTDAMKILVSNNRPHYRGAQDIGTWYKILEIIGVIAVITNCLLVGLSYDAIYKLFTFIDEWKNNFFLFVTIVLLEHGLLFLKYIISELIPDVPAQVRQSIAKQEFIKHETFKLLRKTTLKKWDDNPQDFAQDEHAEEEEDEE